MASDPTPAQLETVHDRSAAEHLLHPLRARLLAEATEPVSATELGERVGEPRQKVNYHVHQLANAGLLEPAGERQERGFTANLYRASARTYLVAPDLLGPLSPAPAEGQDAFSAAHLLALTARTQSELSTVLDDAREAGERVATLSMDATVHFASPGQRKAFTEALQDAIARIVREHTAGLDEAGRPLPGTRPFRLVVASHPTPKHTEPQQTSEDETDDT